MRYFILANSFSAPFVSDTSTHYVEAESPKAALEQFAEQYKHPAGLYAANCYANADAYHTNEKPLAQWLSNSARAREEATAGKSCYSYMGHSPTKFEVDGQVHYVEEPKAGAVV